ncbi:MAG TPA: NAD-dependent epimerase/dehydratase family protein, partial [Acidimicrobiia bacterium]|nr:NAD-dependent epimerase/dehydratase family protein [Acidimicrobiia bacterium]
MRALVTGAAGFIGGHLVEALSESGWEVTAVDNFTPYYNIGQKRANWTTVTSRLNVLPVDRDLLATDLSGLLEDIDVVFHQAGQPGVRASWAEFDSYVDANVHLTRRLLEAARESRIRRFVFASSSSIYGDADVYPTAETALPRPVSPYGVTKLAAEHLCGVYARNWAVPTVSLRYFTVYGPRQRPDMAMHRMIRAAIDGTAFPLFGTGQQIRDFTYVEDVVAANIAVVEHEVEPGSVFNVAGGGGHSMNEVIETVGRLVGSPISLERQVSQKGDVTRTGGSTDKISDAVGWRAVTDLESGLKAQIDWHR